MLTPDWTPEMQRVWDRAMLIARTRGAYGCAFPVAGTSFRPPTAGTMLHDLCFASVADDEAYAAHLAAVREDMLAWKARVGSARPARREPKVNIQGLDLSKLELDL